MMFLPAPFKLFLTMFGGLFFLTACEQQNTAVTYTVLKEKARTSAYGYIWKKPSHWLNAQQSDSFKRIRFLVPPPDDLQNIPLFAKASLTILPGDAGGVVANVNRWRAQLGLPAQVQEEAMASANILQTPLGDISIFKELNSQATKGIYAAIYIGKTETFFVKMKGFIPTLQKNSAFFIDFVSSLHRGDA